MILVTGATGHLGAATIDYLLKKVPATQVAALVRDEAKAAGLKAKGVSVRVGSYQDYASLLQAFKGVEKVLLVSSNDLNDRADHQINAVNAAKEAGVKHIFYTSASSKNPAASAIPAVTKSHLDTENHLKATGVTYTILQNNLYAETIPFYLGEKVLETGVFFPAGEGKVPFALRTDMAEAAANVLSTAGHENKVYNIAGPVSYSFCDVAKLIAEVSGKEVSYTDAPKDVFVDILSKAGVPPVYIGVITGFAEAIKLGEFDLPGNELEQLLGRKVTPLETYLKQLYAK
jgi:NAD(P)H dehydrogenase (quinone)